MIKTKKQSLIVIGVFTLVMLLGTVTYAFFNYTRTGSSNVIKTGRIYFNSTQNGVLNLTNVFPISNSDATNPSANLDSVLVRIQGDTTYVNGEEYEITLVDVNNTIGNKTIPISYIATYTPTDAEESNPTDVIGTNSSDYFSDRGSTNPVYELTSTGIVEEDTRVLAGFIPNNATGIDGTLTIKAYLDKEKIAISDTYNGNETDYMGTTTEWVNDRVVLTTSEWNSLQNSQTPISFKIKVVSNDGIWISEPVTLYNTIKSLASTETIDFSKTSEESNTNGVYTFQENGTDVYYYRGVVDNNVIFGDFCWKIVRTTETGGVKLIYNGIPNNNVCDDEIDGSEVISDYFNSSSFQNDPESTGYMYNNTDSLVKTKIENLFQHSLVSYENKLEDFVFCNDRYETIRELRTDFTSDYYYIMYAPGSRLLSNSPTLTCSQSIDKYTKSNVIGNGLSRYPIGLMTSDEVMLAGGTPTQNNTSYYLYTSRDWWTGSPDFYDYDGSFMSLVCGKNNSSYLCFDFKGRIVSDNATADVLIRPVVSLKPGTLVLSGDGTLSNPYTIIN